MKLIKYIFTVVLLLSFAIHTYAQEGFKVINKAEQKYENGQNRKALALLAKAEKKNYGFCGNAWMDANRAINLLKTKIYIEQGQYQLARNSLDSINWEFKGDNLDSIRIRTYQMAYGKDSLSNMVNLSFENVKIECRKYDCFVNLLLTNGNKVRLKVNSLNTYPLIIIDKDEDKRAKIWVERFRASENFKLIKEKT